MNDPITETFTGTKRDNFTYVTKISLQMIYQLKYNDLTRKYFSSTRSFTNPNYSFSVPYSWLPYSWHVFSAVYFLWKVFRLILSLFCYFIFIFCYITLLTLKNFVFVALIVKVWKIKKKKDLKFRKRKKPSKVINRDITTPIKRLLRCIQQTMAIISLSCWFWTDKFP